MRPSSLAVLSMLSVWSPFVACRGVTAPAVPKEAFLALRIPYSFAPPLPDTFCSGQLTPAQFDRLPSLGIRRVVSLRRANEDGSGWEEVRARQLGLEFVRLPIAGADDLDDEHVAALGRAMAPRVPTLVACASSNRVGALLALKARQDGATPEQALQIGKQCGLARLEPEVRKRLGL
jgi:protein tyrosine phosphatase (PTP) superfamily phosphohydrolase (DUF442 family)